MLCEGETRSSAPQSLLAGKSFSCLIFPEEVLPLLLTALQYLLPLFCLLGELPDFQALLGILLRKHLQFPLQRLHVQPARDTSSLLPQNPCQLLAPGIAFPPAMASLCPHQSLAQNNDPCEPELQFPQSHP